MQPSAIEEARIIHENQDTSNQQHAATSISRARAGECRFSGSNSACQPHRTQSQPRETRHQAVEGTERRQPEQARAPFCRSPINFRWVS